MATGQAEPQFPHLENDAIERSELTGTWQVAPLPHRAPRLPQRGWESAPADPTGPGSYPAPADPLLLQRPGRSDPGRHLLAISCVARTAEAECPSPPRVLYTALLGAEGAALCVSVSLPPPRLTPPKAAPTHRSDHQTGTMQGTRRCRTAGRPSRVLRPSPALCKREEMAGPTSQRRGDSWPTGWAAGQAAESGQRGAHQDPRIVMGRAAHPPALGCLANRGHSDTAS